MRPTKHNRVSKRKLGPPEAQMTRSAKKPAQNVCQTRECSVGDIPNEILSEILMRCDEETLRIAMRTCRRWHAVINETIGVSVAIGKPYMTLARKPPVPFQAIEVIKNLGIKHCYVGELTDVKGYHFAYPQAVRNMVFDGPITKFNLVTLLSPLSGLTHLHMHYSCLETTKFTQDILNSATLKSLRITSHGLGDEFDRIKAVTIMKNLISLLNSISSQQLAVLILDVIHIPSYDLKLTESVFAVLLRHKYTMKNLQFYYFAERLEPSPPGTEIQIVVDKEFVKKKIIAKALKEAVNLKRISFGGKRYMESEEAWNQLVQSQRFLRELFYMNDNRAIHSNCIPSLAKNSATLQKTLFHLSGVDEAGNVVKLDCRVLSKFQKLSHLLIRGRRILFPFVEGVQQLDDVDIAVPRFTVRVPMLRNIEHIPTTVTVFSMRDIGIETETLSKLIDISFLPNLKKFRLVDCGSVGGFGINPETLIELLRRKSLQEIEIIKSFSLISWDNVGGKDIYEDALFFRVKTMWEFHAERDNSGIFCTKDEPMFNYGRFETNLRADDVCEVVFQ